MDDLTDEELDELAEEMSKFLKKLGGVGLHSVIIASGRGYSNVVYGKDVEPYVADVLVKAWQTVMKKQEQAGLN